MPDKSISLREESFLKKAWQKFKNETRFGRWFIRKHDHAQRAMLIAFLVALGLLVAFLASGAFILSFWYLAFATILGFMNSTVSGAKYIGAVFDERTKKSEKIGAIIASIVGIVVTTLAARFAQIPLVGTFLGRIGADFEFGLRTNNTLGSIGYRTGGLDNKDRPTHEKWYTGASGIAWGAIGAVIGVKVASIVTIPTVSALLPTGITALVAVCPPAVIPLVTTVFFLSAGMAAGDNAGKMVSYLQCCYYEKYKPNNLSSDEQALVKRVNSRIWEYRLATLGVVIGAVVASVALPYLVVGLGAAFATAVVATTIMGFVALCGSAGGNVGRWKDKKVASQNAAEEEQSLLHPADPDSQHEPKNSEDTTIDDQHSPQVDDDQHSPQSNGSSPSANGDGSSPSHSSNGSDFQTMTAKFSRAFAKFISFFSKSAPLQAVPTAKEAAVAQSSVSTPEKAITPSLTTSAKVISVLEKRKAEADEIQSIAITQVVEPAPVQSTTPQQAAPITEIVLPVKIKQEETQATNQTNDALSAKMVHEVGMFKPQTLETMPELEVAAMMHDLPTLAPAA